MVRGLENLDSSGVFRATGGNTGNLLFTHALTQILDTELKSLPWGDACSEYSPETHCLVVPLANNLGPHCDLKKLSALFERSPLPMVGIGLGAQGPISGIDPSSIPEGSWKWFQTLASKAPGESPNISLRGSLTQEVISKKGFAKHCIVTGCPSNFINPSGTLGQIIGRRAFNPIGRIVVAAGNPHLKRFAKLEESLTRLVQDTDGTYVCQHPLDMVALSQQDSENSVEIKSLFLYNRYLRPDLDPDSFVRWMRRYSYSFSYVPEWIRSMRKHDFVIGTRIHGVMAGIQAGIPSVCLCIDSRTRELCEKMMIPWLDANNYREGIRIEDALERIKQWNWKEFDTNRSNLAQQLSDFLRSNHVSTGKRLSDIISSFEDYYSRYSSKKDTNIHQHSTVAHYDRYPVLFRYVASLFDRQASKILSYGCSNGLETLVLASKYFPHSYIDGVDVNADQVNIAQTINPSPYRVRHYTSDELDLINPFESYDIVFAMSVLCRWPDTKGRENIADLYSFSDFEKGLQTLISLVKPGGMVVIFNSNYAVAASQHSSQLEPINIPLHIKSDIDMYDPAGNPLVGDQSIQYIFRKLLHGC